MDTSVPDLDEFAWQADHALYDIDSGIVIVVEYDNVPTSRGTRASPRDDPVAWFEVWRHRLLQDLEPSGSTAQHSGSCDNGRHNAGQDSSS